MVQVVSLIWCYYNFREKSHLSNLDASVPEYENTLCTALAGPSASVSGNWTSTWTSKCFPAHFKSSFWIMPSHQLFYTKEVSCTAKGLTALVGWGWGAYRRCGSTCFAACLWLPKPWHSLWCAKSGLTQKKNAMYWITSATSCSNWEFLWESPNWYYQALKLSLETE